MPAPEPTNSPAPITPPRAIIDRWRCLRPWEREESTGCRGASVVVLLDMERLVQCVGGRGQGKSAHSFRSRAARRQRMPTIRTDRIRNVIIRMRGSVYG
ncbi:hypothetical protein STENM327S_01182 [Streptomyces tendae]